MKLGFKPKYKKDWRLLLDLAKTLRLSNVYEFRKIMETLKREGLVK